MTTSVALSPVWNGQQFFDNEGKPLAGGKIFTYEGSSWTVQKATFTSSAGDVMNSNPLVLDSSGRVQTSIWLTAGVTYNFVLTNSQDTAITSVGDVTGTAAATGTSAGSGAVWNLVATPTYVAPTQFLVGENLVSEFTVGNRVQITQSGNFVYGTVNAVTFSYPNTTVTLVLDGPTLTSGLTAAAWSAAIVNGDIIDAGAVKWTETLPYSNSGTVGNKLRVTTTEAITAAAAIAGLQRVWTTTGTASAFVLTPTPPTTGLDLSNWLVKFGADSINATLNISGLGARNLKQYNATGDKISPAIQAGQITGIAFDGTDLIVLDALPPIAAAFTGEPHGNTTFIVNGSWTCPVNVHAVRITCIGGGGGGNGGYVVTGGDSTPANFHDGPVGGYGGVAIAVTPVTPGTAYSITIGAGGLPGRNGGSIDTLRGVVGGTTSFGSAVVSATGGGPNGSAGTIAAGNYGTAGVAYIVQGAVRGAPGAGGSVSGAGVAPTAGAPGAILLEW